MRHALYRVGSGFAVIGVVFVGLRLHDYAVKINFALFTEKSWIYLIGLVFIYCVINIMPAMAWRSLLEQFGSQVSRRWSIKSYSIAQLAKYVPGNIFHFTARQAIGVAAKIPGWSLAKSIAWELGLMAIAGAMLGCLALPLLISSLKLTDLLGAFLLATMLMFILCKRFIGRAFAHVFGIYLSFLAISGLIFTSLVFFQVNHLFTSSAINWLTMIGAYTAAWLIGLVVPGAPAGIGIREAMLLFLLNNQIAEENLLLFILQGRVVTVMGDLVFFILCIVLIKSKKIST